MNNDDNGLEPVNLETLRSGDQGEFAKLVELYSEKIYALALRMLNNQQDAEDVLQETFLKAYKALPGFEGKSTLSTWLYRIAVNESLMLIRKHRPEKFLIPEDKEDENEETPEIVDWCCLPEKELVDAETRKKLAEASDQLSPNLKAVFLLRDLEGLSVKETAEVLNVSESVVKTRLLRARMRLRQELSRYFAERMENEVKHE